MLDDLRKREATDNIALVRELAANPVQDEVKLFVTHKALAFRKSNLDLFSRGEYIPLEVRGRFANHVCAFARALGRQWAVVAAPRWRSTVDDWGETAIVPPAGVPEGWRDAITCLIPPSWKLSDLLAEFPIALLGNEPV
jgi:(1->4)-alpha-D-glucan 1-alpha-D-glucosylmutase